MKNIILKKLFHFLKKHKYDLLIFVFLAVTIFILFQDLLKYSLCCDDYFLFYGIRIREGSRRALLELFTGPYGGQYLFLYLVRKLVGYTPFYFNLLSILFRIIAAYSLYLIGQQITNKRLVGFTAAVLFGVGYASIQTSESVVNCINYLSLVFLDFGILFLIGYYRKNIKQFNMKRFLLPMLMFFIALALSPIRSNGIIFLFVLTEFALLIFKMSDMVNIIKRITVFIILIILVKYIGYFRPEGSSTIGPIESIVRLLHSPNIMSTLSFPFTNFYEMIFPNKIADKIHLLRYDLGYLIFVLNVLFVFYLYKVKRVKESITLLLLLLWPFCFLFIPYLYYPNENSGTFSRYMLISAAGVYLFLSYLSFILIEITKSKTGVYIRAAIILFFLIIIFANASETKKEITLRLWSRDNNVVQVINDTINNEIKNRLAINRPVVYVYGDDSQFIYIAVTYGGQERIGLINGYTDTHNFPYYVTSYETLVDLVKDNKLSSSIGLKPVRREDIFAFKITDRRIKSETSVIREQMAGIILQ